MKNRNAISKSTLVYSRISILAAFIGAMGGAAHAEANLEAGKAKATTLCAACHGANGVSVANHIPNLAAQRESYITAQLNAFKDKSRKSDIMAVIAPQLSAEDMANVAAYFARLPGAPAAAKSDFLPGVAKSHVTIPADFPAGFRRYRTENLEAAKQVKMSYANEKAIAAATSGKRLPDGSMIVVQTHAAKLDANQKPVIGSDGFYVPEKIYGYAAMASGEGWGKDIPEQIRNENWNYAIFSATKEMRTTVNQAECLACHVPSAKDSYVFTLKDIVALKK